MNILGLSGLYHDSAAALLKDGAVIAAAQEERFSRKKHDNAFPQLAAQYCLAEGQITAHELDAVIFYEKPLLKFERILFTHFRLWPHTFKLFLPMLKTWVETKFRIRSQIRKKLNYKGPILFCKHHEAHAASTFYTSTFTSSAIVTLDGVGEWTTTGIFHGVGSQITPLKEIQFPHSLGLFYSSFTAYLGFEVNEDEYKVMGLAPYGKPRYLDILREHFLRLSPDGSFELNRELFSFEHSNSMLNTRACASLLGLTPRKTTDPITKDHHDLAASVQKLLEEAVVNVCKHAIHLTGEKRLCLAGGVALNCVANSEIKKAIPDIEIYVFPAAGDAGGAVGAATYAYYELYKNSRTNGLPLEHVFLGPGYSQTEIEKFLTSRNISFKTFTEANLTSHVAKLLADQQVIGWFQGRMEFGPRALGNRSILADPTKKENWPRVNQKIKFREDFRPLAPAICEEDVETFFDATGPHPYMLFTVQSKTTKLPAVTHIDGSSRLQTVSPIDNPRFHRLLKEFGAVTGVPVLLNTSFNTSGEAIVCSPEDAWNCFCSCDMDKLVMGLSLIEIKPNKVFQ